MQIHGLNKTTLLDYPERVAATLFTGGCNFRCPFCQNSDLVLNPLSQPMISEEEIFAFLKKRKGVLSGICITGGEPTLQPDLKEFCEKVKELDYQIKLDTNGYHPEVIEELCKNHLIDYVAMDVKNSLEHYEIVAGITPLDKEKIIKSIDFIRSSWLEYEFRTTVVRELHNEEDFRLIGELLKGVRAYYLQAFRDDERVMKQGFSAYTREEMEAFAKILRQTISKVELRGLD